MDTVIFDLETTGLSPVRDEIIQIAGMRMRTGQVLESETFSTFVRPRQPISGFISSYTGITNHHVREAPGAAEALRAFSEFVGGAVLIAHNGRRFDMPFLRESCAREGLETRPVGFFDSIDFSKRVWGGRGGHGLDAVMARLNLKADGERRHDARSDVRILAEAVRRMWSQFCPECRTSPVPQGTGVLAR
ncbi:DNA polymerase-3 subunit epsilon [Verrucomicrobium sp. GAS474]|uniref:3'-5' exonuclease n=1 Tax=Verrucomicrobium sp. GAS474 TaxID=1882831 RepID=UPI00087A5AE6|nr:3'-5' exonuclease [Verrucomicrobium sp. GAS474]SDT91661.1 DNA polymerase-3 subunit epsilon [Verrucomicrobium sp. GAS474]